jgi:hypothetical protein
MKTPILTKRVGGRTIIHGKFIPGNGLSREQRLERAEREWNGYGRSRTEPIRASMTLGAATYRKLLLRKSRARYQIARVLKIARALQREGKTKEARVLFKSIGLRPKKKKKANS